MKHNRGIVDIDENFFVLRLNLRYLFNFREILEKVDQK